MDIRKFGSDTDLVSLWDGTVVYNESVLFLEDADGSVPDAPLLYHPDEILQVCSSTCDVEYREGVDFAVVDGKLRRLPGSRIPTLPHNIPYPAEKTEDVWSFDCIDGGLIALTRFAGEIGFYPDEYLEIIRLYLGIGSERRNGNGHAV